MILSFAFFIFYAIHESNLQNKILLYNVLMTSDRKTVLLLGDIAALAGAYCLMALIRFDVGSQGGLLWLQIKFFAFLFLMWIIIFFIFDLYDLRRVNPNPRNIGLLIASMAINVALAALGFYLFPSVGIAPKTNLAILGSSALVLLIVWRRLFYLLFTRTFIQSIGIIGKSPLIEHLKEDFAKHPHMGRVVAHWSDEQSLTRDTVDLIIAESIPPRTLLALSYQLDTEALSLSEAYEILFSKIPLSLMTDEKAVHLVTKRTSPALHGIYRLIEIVLASIILILASPVLFIAIIARLIEDGRPVFIRQDRVGKNGSIFKLYKLRSMRALAPDGSAEQQGVQWAEKKRCTHYPGGTYIARNAHR